ncbi:MAG: response regulator [Vulcanimicrobiota bacterium]
MDRSDPGPALDNDYRRRAEQRYKEEFSLEQRERCVDSSVESLLYELRVHQIELEMQNEELRQARDELEQSRELYFDLYQMAPVGYLSLDLKGGIIGCNLAASKLLGETPEELIAQPLAKFVHQEDSDSFYLRHRELLKEGRLPVYEMRLVGKETSPSVLVEASMVSTPVEQIRMVLFDVTERNRLFSQLLRSQKMEALGRLAGGIAHDFNNILSIVRGGSELILSQLDPEDPNRELLLDIRDASERASRLTYQLLGLGRRQEEGKVVFDLNQVVKELMDLVSSAVGEEFVIENALCHEVLQVCAVPSQIEQVLMNFALNARDAMPDGGKLRIETRWAHLSEGQVEGGKPCGRYAVVSVRDQGRGIPLEIRDRVYEPFFTTKDKSKGRGLGLATAAAIADRSLGFIELDSEVGKGTCFSLFLPASQSELEVAPPAVSTRRAGRVRGETVLVVEDEPGVRKIACRILEQEGYRILSAESGPQALELFRSLPLPPSILLTDVVMPRMSGFQLAATLKESTPDLKILFMSGYADDVLKSSLAPAGARFLAKPFSRAELCSRVRETLDH